MKNLFSGAGGASNRHPSTVFPLIRSPSPKRLPSPWVFPPSRTIWGVNIWPSHPSWDSSDGSSPLQNSLWAGGLYWDYITARPPPPPILPLPPHRTGVALRAPPPNSPHLVSVSEYTFPGTHQQQWRSQTWPYSHPYRMNKVRLYQEKQEFIKSLLTFLDLYPLKRF